MAWLAVTAACRQSASVTPATESPATRPQQPDHAATGEGLPRIDSTAVHALLTALAGDDLRGRATLSADIRRAAAALAGNLRDTGVKPVGDDFIHDYAIVTGAREKAPTRVTLGTGDRTVLLPTDSFVAHSASSSAEVEGELVFVGYAANSTPDSPAYDDLAAVEVKGRIAIVLTEAPRRPRTEDLMGALRREVDHYNLATTDARLRKDIRAVERGQRSLRTAIAKVLAPFTFGRPLPASVPVMPVDPFSPLDVSAVLRPLLGSQDHAHGPRFEARQTRLNAKLTRLREAGAIAAIVVTGPRSFVDRTARERDALPELETTHRSGKSVGMPVIQLRWHEAEKHLRIAGRKLSQVQAQIDRELVPRSRVLPGARATIAVDIAPIERPAPNVLGYIPGTDLAGEIVVIGGHFDHLGTPETGDCMSITRKDGTLDSICNGADDNASGTAAVSAIAQAWGRSKRRPRRTLVFAHFSGEEIGLLGSSAIAETPPDVAPFAGGRVVAMLNLDMIGRLRGKGLEVGGLSSSSGWAPIIDRVDFGSHAVLLERSVTSRSDHAGFYRRGIPVLFFFTGVHDDYHRPSDEIGGVDVDGVIRIADWVDEIVLQLADGAKIPFTPAQRASEGLVATLPGSDPATHTRRLPASVSTSP